MVRGKTNPARAAEYRTSARSQPKAPRPGDKQEADNSKGLRPGTRVRLRAPDPLLDLTSDTGTVLEPSEWDYYYLVRLDEPARHRHVPGRIEETRVICEAIENLEVLEPN